MTKRPKKNKDTRIVLSQHPDVVATRKFELWCAFYFDKNNKKTYLNATQSALRAYNTEKDYVAWNIGSRNARKAKVLGVTVAELEGYGFGDRIRIAIAKAVSGDYNDWHKLLVQFGDFEEKPQSLVQNNFNFDNLAEEIARSRRERGLQP